MNEPQYVIRTKSAYEGAAFVQVLAKAGIAPVAVEGDGHKVLWWYVYADDLQTLYAAAQNLLVQDQHPQGLLAVAADLGAKVHDHVLL